MSDNVQLTVLDDSGRNCQEKIRMMKLYRRYIIVTCFVAIFVCAMTFYVYNKVKLKLTGLHAFQLTKEEYNDALSSNSNSDAIFYEVYEKSRLSDVLKGLDRKHVNDAIIRNFLSKPEAIELFQKLAINVAFSDIIPLNRHIPDSRPRG